MIQTDLDQQRADQSAQTQAQSITPINIGSPTVDASKWKSFFDKWNGYAQGIPKVDAPSESDIRDGMWESSFVVALLAGLATGDAAAGITGGLWAAIAVHDEGYARRDRAQYVTQLYTQGISAPAIMQWYETGDTKILEQEKDRIQREADHKDELEMRRDEMQQQKGFHNDQLEQERLTREQSQRNADRMYTLDEAKFLLDKQKADAAASGNGDTRTAIKNLQQLATHNNTENTKVKNATDFVVKGLTAPSTQAGAQQLGMSVMGAETGVSPRPTQVTHMIEGWAPGSMGAVGTWIEQASNNGIPESGMQAGRGMLMNNAKSMWSENAQNAINTLSNQGYDTSNPNVMQAMQAAYPNIPSDSLKKLVDGNMTADQYANQQADHYQSLYRPNDSTSSNSDNRTTSDTANADNKQRWPSAPDIGHADDGYKYKGGNPANPASWEKI